MNIDSDIPKDSTSSTSEDEEDASTTPVATRPTRASAVKANRQILTHHKPCAPRRFTTNPVHLADSLLAKVGTFASNEIYD